MSFSDRQNSEESFLNPEEDTSLSVVGIAGRPLGAAEKSEIEDRQTNHADLVSDVLDSLAAHIVVLDKKGTIIAVNEAWRQFARENRDPHSASVNKTGIGANYLDVCRATPGNASEDCAIAYQGLKAVLEGEQDHFAFEYACPTPTRNRWFLMSATPLKSKRSGATVSHQDITDRKLAEEQIAEQAALLDSAQDAILVRDLDGKILFWNRGAERLYGWKGEEAIGRDVGQLLHPDPKVFVQKNAQMLANGEWSGEIRHVTKDQRKLTVESRWTLIRDREGRPRSVLGINTDITEKKKIEAQFLRAQRMESIGTLAGGIAHDLNNILSPIMMSIDILKATTDHPQAQSILETIGVSAKRGADIVRQVLSFARGLDGERIEIQPKHLIKDLEQIIQDTFPKDIRLQFSVPSDTWTILGDPTQVHQVLLNLCVNARDAMPNGGNLTVEIENCVLDEHYAAMSLQAKPGSYVKMSVTDMGMGIPAEILDKIFEPFFTTKDVNKGTGLGLSTTLAIVKSHEGLINVYSEPGKGTTFHVYFPAAQMSSEARKEQLEEANLPRGNGEVVLLVDDETSIRTITSQTLQAFGYRVMTAADGAEALAIYAQHRDEIALVLTDMKMPVLDGPATIHALMKINPLMKIIAASGLDANGSVAKVAGAGVKYFLTKPYTAATLLKTIRILLDEKQKIN
jgi:two-component system cell cycle sensor histidine kinase/response regulator CckA